LQDPATYQKDHPGSNKAPEEFYPFRQKTIPKVDVHVLKVLPEDRSLENPRECGKPNGDVTMPPYPGGRMSESRLRARYLRIMFFFSTAAADFIFWELFLPFIGLRALTRRTRSGRLKRTASDFRALAIRMGGLMIKVGQFLSSRLDVLPAEITRELAGLQDEVPPEKFEDIRRIAQAELGAPLNERFEIFEEQPLAAASLGQVHRARLCVHPDETPAFCSVVVKIQRPEIDRLIEVDLRALRQVGGWLEHYKPVRKRADVRALVEEFAGTVHEEVDYLAEARNAQTFGEHFRDDPRVHVPRVVPSHTTLRVLTLEDVFAIKITDYAAITAAGVDRSEVARVLLDTYLKQIFDHDFFHADPHPGNLFITPRPAAQAADSPAWRLTFVDFGMVGRVPENLRAGLREMIVGIGTRDPSRLTRSYQILGILLPGADLAQIERMESQMFDLFWGKSMAELREISLEEMHRFAHRFEEVMYSMPFQLPQNLLLLGRTVAILSGMCTGLDPEFNLWTQLAPYAEKLIAKEAGSNWRVWLDTLGDLAKKLLALPAQADRVLTAMERGELNVRSDQLARRIGRLENAVNRLAGSVVFAAFFLGALWLLENGRIPSGLSLLAVSTVALLGTLLSGRIHHPE
jgi:predicted unusual protein kinase regulating ubiquinone biosynthesis (AarF/ABC1/UbiB family)